MATVTSWPPAAYTDVTQAALGQLEDHLRLLTASLDRLRQQVQVSLEPQPVMADGWRLDNRDGDLVGPAGTEKRIRLTPSEAKLTDLLLRSQGRVVPRTAILAALGYGAGTHTQGRNVDTLVRRLRNKLEAASGEGLIETVFGFGYRWKGGEACR